MSKCNTNGEVYIEEGNLNHFSIRDHKTGEKLGYVTVEGQERNLLVIIGGQKICISLPEEK